MIQRLRARWKRWRSSLWFVPAAMVMAAFLAAIGMIQLSGFVPRELLIRYPRLFGADAQSSRSMLSTIAGSMATIAGVTFSITVVAVAQASSQYTSRILRNFLSDRPSQLMLGMLAGTFVYCLVLIRTIRGDADLLFIPGLGVLGAFALAIVSIAYLVYFIHHIAESLQASQVLARVRRETIAAIDRTYPDIAESTDADTPPRRAGGGADGLAWRWTNARVSGYLQEVDHDALVAWACRHNAVVRLEYRIGEFLIEGTPILATASYQRGTNDGGSPEGADTSLTDACSIGAYRTIDDDASFGIQQVVDIANKALSPGINDATTAVTAIDTLAAILIRLGTRCVEPPVRSVDNVERVIAPAHSYQEFLGLSMDQLRRSASADVGVSIHLLHSIARVSANTPSLARRVLLAASADLVRESAIKQAAVPADAAAIEAAHARVRSPAPRDY